MLSEYPLRVTHEYRLPVDDLGKLQRFVASDDPRLAKEISPMRLAGLPVGAMQHLKALEDSGLVSTKKTGRVRTAQLEGDALSAAESWLKDRRREWEAQADRLEAFLESYQDNGDLDGR